MCPRRCSAGPPPRGLKGPSSEARDRASPCPRTRAPAQRSLHAPGASPPGSPLAGASASRRPHSCLAGRRFPSTSTHNPGSGRGRRQGSSWHLMDKWGNSGCRGPDMCGITSHSGSSRPLAFAVVAERLLPSCGRKHLDGPVLADENLQTLARDAVLGLHRLVRVGRRGKVDRMLAYGATSSGIGSCAMAETMRGGGLLPCGGAM